MLVSCSHTVEYHSRREGFGNRMVKRRSRHVGVGGGGYECRGGKGGGGGDSGMLNT